MSRTPIWTTRDVARWVRAARRAHGWNQSDLASRANVSRSVIQKLEAGRGRTVNLDTVLSLLRTLSLDISIEPRSAKLKNLADQLEDDA